MPTPSLPREQLVLVLHIGSGKTGSSSIQHFFRRNREQLAQRRCLYPQTPGASRHFRLGLFIKSDSDLEASVLWRAERGSEPATFRETLRRELHREIDQSGLSRVVLSDESLYDQADDLALRRLRRLTDEIGTSLRLVVYLRRQDDHLVSRYQQRVRNGTEIRRMDEFARQDMSFPYDYDAGLRTWERCLEPDRFVVRPFERDAFVDGSLIQDFVHAADVDVRVEELEQVPRRNDSLDAESVEFLRLFNLYRFESAGITPGFLRELAVKSPYQQPVKIDNRGVVAQLRKASGGPRLTLPGHVLDDFMAQWEASNRAVAQKYLGDPSGVLFRSRRRTDNTTTTQHLDPDRIDHFLALLELPQRMHEPLRRLAEREAKPADALPRRARRRSRIRSMAIAGTARFRQLGSRHPTP